VIDTDNYQASPRYRCKGITLQFIQRWSHFSRFWRSRFWHGTVDGQFNRSHLSLAGELPTSRLWSAVE